MRRRPLRHVTFTLGVAITALLIATAALSLVYTPADPLAMSITGRLQGPSGPHPFGTDQYGRDVLSRVMTGTVISIAVGVIAVGIGAALGMLIGILSGYVGGWVDEAFMRLIDAIQGFPGDSLRALVRRGVRSRHRHQHGRDRHRVRAGVRATDPRGLPRASRARVRRGRSEPSARVIDGSLRDTSCRTRSRR